jgi:hypothetical protein
MTASKVIERVDKLLPNAYDDETKLTWISEFDGMIKKLVFQEGDGEPYRFPEDMNKELLVPFPYDNLYVHLLEVKIHLYNREYDDYNNLAMVFENRLSEYKKAYIREHAAKG